MNSDLTNTTDAELLYGFLGQFLAAGGRDQPVQAVIDEFAAYRSEVRRLQELVAVAHQESDAGLSGPLDIEAVVARGKARLAAEGNR